MAQISEAKAGPRAPPALPRTNLDVSDFGLSFHQNNGIIFNILAPKTQAKYVKQYLSFKEYQGTLATAEQVLIGYAGMLQNGGYATSTIISRMSMVRSSILIFEGISTNNYMV